MTPPKVLVLSRNYPNPVLPYVGLWIERLVRQLAGSCEQRVIAPVPYYPPLPGPREYTRFRHVPAQTFTEDVPVYHPRFLAGPGGLFHCTEAWTSYLGVRGLVKRLRGTFPFELIHAHFSYPDGVVAEWLGREYGVPVVVTEHALWRSWIEQDGLVRRQTLEAASRIRFHIAVSRAGRDSIARVTRSESRLRIIPVGVDSDAFPLGAESQRRPAQVLYVGFLKQNKGVDLLLRAMQRVASRLPDARLVLAGGSYYRNARLAEDQLRRLAVELGLGDRVTFLGPQPPEEVARLMRESAMLVLPSRGESFGAVLVEALASGTPVLATRCGGPEDIVTDEVGLLVPPEDDQAIARGIEHILWNRHRYDPRRLRAYALERFSWERVAEQTVDLYREALGRTRGAARKTRGALCPVRG